jgi:NAD(P)H dehydrogenase (quinone)
LYPQISDFTFFIILDVTVFKPTPASNRVLVTGATGTIGQNIAKSLLFTKAQTGVTAVRVATRNERKASALRKLGIEVAVVDYSKPDTLDNALSGVDRLVIVAPFSVDLTAVNKAWVDAAKRSDVKYIVKSGGYGSDMRAHVVGEWHDEAEKYVINSGIPYTFVRPTFLISNTFEQITDIKVSASSPLWKLYCVNTVADAKCLLQR